MKKALFAVFVFLSLIPGCLAVNINATLVANQIDYQLSNEFVSFLKENKINITYTTANQFLQEKNSKFIIILGGHMAPDTGSISMQALSGDEQDFLEEQNGNRGIFVKENLWAKSQKVIVIAGKTRNDTRLAAYENYDKILSILTEKNSSISIESLGVTKSDTYAATFFTYIAFSVVNNGKVTFKPTIDLKIINTYGNATLFSDSDISNISYHYFKPGARWFENHTYFQKLEKGKYVLRLNLRDMESPDIIAADNKNFTVS